MTDPRFVSRVFIPRTAKLSEIEQMGIVLEYDDTPPILCPLAMDSDPNVAELLSYNRAPFAMTP